MILFHNLYKSICPTTPHAHSFNHFQVRNEIKGEQNSSAKKRGGRSKDIRNLLYYQRHITFNPPEVFRHRFGLIVVSTYGVGGSQDGRPGW